MNNDKGLKGKNVAIILTGRNLDLSLLYRILGKYF